MIMGETMPDTAPPPLTSAMTVPAWFLVRSSALTRMPLKAAAMPPSPAVSRPTARRQSQPAYDAPRMPAAHTSDAAKTFVKTSARSHCRSSRLSIAKTPPGGTAA